MVLTPSTMSDLGTQAPHFELSDVKTNKKVSLSDFSKNKALLVMFISRHCPYVQHIKKELTNLGKDYIGKDLGMVAISSNEIVNYPDDAPEKLKNMAEELKLTFPICFDESQKVAKAYRAACTPDFFLFDQNRTLVYRGQLDDSRPGNNKPATGKDLRAAIDAVLSGKKPSLDQRPSLGCNIKWKAGNEPDYFSH